MITRQNFYGPYDSCLSMTSAPFDYLGMLFARLEDNQYLTESRVCRRTYYPIIWDEAGDPDQTEFRAAKKEFRDHCR